jgi:hypothetical protein
MHLIPQCKDVNIFFKDNIAQDNLAKRLLLIDHYAEAILVTV